MDAAEVAQVRAETPGLNSDGKLSGAYLNNAGAALVPQVVVRIPRCRFICYIRSGRQPRQLNPWATCHGA